MTNMNGKIYANVQGKQYMVLNEGYYLDFSGEVVIFVSIDSDDDTWYVRERQQFLSLYTEKESGNASEAI